jgi:hypothetical protein
MSLDEDKVQGESDDELARALGVKSKRRKAATSVLVLGAGATAIGYVAWSFVAAQPPLEVVEATRCSKIRAITGQGSGMITRKNSEFIVVKIKPIAKFTTSNVGLLVNGEEAEFVGLRPMALDSLGSWRGEQSPFEAGALAFETPKNKNAARLLATDLAFVVPESKGHEQHIELRPSRDADAVRVNVTPGCGSSNN